jgi:putative MATE family efflux protein
MSSKSNFLSREPVRKVLFVLGGLGIVSMVSEGLYGVLDKYFISVLGIENVEAVALVFGISFLIMAMAMWLSLGGMVYVSVANGDGDIDKVNRGKVTILIIALMGGLLLNIFLYFFSEPILSIFTLSDSSKITPEVISLANIYLNVISFTAIPMVVMLSLNFILRSLGYSIIPTLSTILTALVNAAFDYYVINYTDLGIAGIGWATVIGFTVSMVFLLIVFYVDWKKSRRKSTKLFFQYFSVETALKVLSLGMPSLGKQLSTLVAITIFNLFASLISSQLVAGWGVATDIFTLALFVTYGLNMGMMPLLGFSYGSKDYSRSLEAINTTFLISFGVFAVYSVFVYIFAYEIMDIYFVESSTIEMGVEILRALSISFPVVGIIVHGSNALQVFDMKFASLMVGISRQLLFFIPFVGGIYFYNKYFGTSINIVWGQVIADVIAFAIMAWYYFEKIRPELLKR